MDKKAKYKTGVLMGAMTVIVTGIVFEDLVDPWMVYLGIGLLLYSTYLTVNSLMEYFRKLQTKD